MITGLFTLEFCCTHFLNYLIPYFERVPEVIIGDLKERQSFNIDLCDNITDYTLSRMSEIHISIVYEFDIMCNKTKIYFIGISYNIGKFFGAIFAYLIIDRIGRKIPLLIFIPLSIVLMAVLKFMKASNSLNWIYGIYVDLFLSGICNYVIIVDILI